MRGTTAISTTASSTFHNSTLIWVTTGAATFGLCYTPARIVVFRDTAISAVTWKSSDFATTTATLNFRLRNGIIGTGSITTHLAGLLRNRQRVRLRPVL
ncbi:MAG: hypothetical protein OXI24_21570, partial [Candidatus Poribacteria bacterium]|nr:hypothetical protein [Candidatus Poribacteria bacterium]